MLDNIQTEVSICGVCNFHYDSRVRPPIIICQQQHLVCETCHDRYFTKKEAQCPKCMTKIDKNKIAKFRLYPKFEMKYKQSNQNYFSKINQDNKILLPYVGGIIDIMAKGQERYKLSNVLMELIQRRIRQKRFSEAIFLITKMIELRPVQCMAQQLIGLGCKEASLGFCEDESFDQLVNRYQRSFSLFDLLAYCFEKQKNYQQASNYYRKLIQSQTNYANCYQVIFGNAVSDHNAGKTQSALELYTDVLKINPNFSQSYALMALIYLSQKENQLATHQASKCLHISQTNSIALYVIAITRSNSEQSTTNLMKLIEMQPKYVRAINAFGEIWLKERCFMKAKTQFERCLVINKSFIEPKVNIGKVLHELKDYEGSIKALIDATSHDKKTESICFLYLGRNYYDLNQFRTALRYLQACRGLEPQEATESYTIQAKIHLKLNQYRQATNFAKMVLISPNYNIPEQRKTMYKLIVKAFISLKDIESTDEWIKKWQAQISDQKHQIYMIMIKKQYELGNFKKVVKYFENDCLKGIVLPKSIYYDMVTVYQKMNQIEKLLKLKSDYLSNYNPSAEEDRFLSFVEYTSKKMQL